jgi:hypothetical protein
LVPGAPVEEFALFHLSTELQSRHGLGIAEHECAERYLRGRGRRAMNETPMRQ